MSDTIENVLILQVGGFLWAFGCGVYKALANKIKIREGVLRTNQKLKDIKKDIVHMPHTVGCRCRYFPQHLDSKIIAEIQAEIIIDFVLLIVLIERRFC
jgi:hypothetical protein